MQERPKVQYKHVYVVTRLDIPYPHRAIQIGHAIGAVGSTYGLPVKHPNLVLCGVANEQELNDLFNEWKEKGIQCVAWYEEDMGNELTAICTAAMDQSQRKHFRSLQLIRD